MNKAKAAAPKRHAQGAAAKLLKTRGKAAQSNVAASAKKKVKNSKTELANRAQTPITLYYWPTPNGHKISIMLEELGVPYEVHLVNISKGEQFEPAFLKISPNNRMPALVDRDGPGGKPISVFESGAILQYLGRKYGRFYPSEERRRVQVEEWLYWQVGGLGPMAGQANHFLNYAPEDLAYAKKRYTDEVHRLFGVMNGRLEGRRFLAGDYSIADMACWSWVLSASKYIAIDQFPHLGGWIERVGARKAVQRGKAIAASRREPLTEEARKHLFGQRAR